MTTDKPLSAEKCLDKIIHEYRRHNVFQPIARGGQVGIHLASEREAKPFAIFQIEAYAAQQCAEKDNRIAELTAHVKLLREALEEISNETLCEMGYCYNCHVGHCDGKQKTPSADMATKALAATDSEVYQ